MRKRYIKNMLMTLVVVILTMSTTFALAEDKVNGFPLPTNKSYAVTVLSRYSGGGNHDSYLYTYGPLKGQNVDRNVVMDISASAWTPIYAVASGTVRTNKYGNNGGNYLVIAHDDGTYSYYGHMQSRSSYGVGSRVNAGDIIGYVGKTGTASGYHLHFEWSWHDPYCEYSSKGYVYTCPKSGASVYPHTHANTTATTNNNNNGAYTAYAVNTDGSLAINSTNAAGHQIGSIPEGASCTVYPNRSVGNWRWVEYNGVSGYSYYKYLTTNKPNSGSNSISFSVSATGTSSTNTWTGTVRGTDGSLVINSKPKVGNDIGYIPEGATCTVYPDKTSGNWYWVEYNGIRGYSYKSYIVQNSSSSSNTRKGIIRGTDGSLVINSKPKVGNDIGYIPEGATCTVYPDKTSGNWYWVEYNGISGYSYKSYIVLQ